MPFCTWSLCFVLKYPSNFLQRTDTLPKKIRKSSPLKEFQWFGRCPSVKNTEYERNVIETALFIRNMFIGEPLCGIVVHDEELVATADDGDYTKKM